MDAEYLLKFIPDYPLVDDSGISNSLSYNIAQRKEFQELRLTPTEEVSSKQGTPLLSQELQARFFSPHTPYRVGLLYHAVGTGKTCTSALIVENFKDFLVNGQKRKPALVLVPNEDLARSYQSQVAFQCAKEGIYTPQFTDQELEEMRLAGMTKEMTEEKRRRRLKKLISQTYEIRTYDKFLFKKARVKNKDVTVPRHPQNEEHIRKIYDNRIIIIDEAHNFRIQPKKKSDGDISSASRYQELHRFLHAVPHSRIILLSGTPIWDQVHEISSLMNLLLPLDKQLPTGSKFLREFFDGEGVLYPEKIPLLKEIFHGKISVLRAMISSAVRKEIGIRKPLTKYIKVYPSVMSEYHYNFARRAAEKVEVVKFTYKTKDNKIITKSREIKGGTIGRDARDADIFVFPVFDKNNRIVGGDYGIKAFNANVRTLDKGKSYDYILKKTKEELKNNLPRYSSVFSAIIEHVKQHPNELVFIADDFVKGGGGTINLGLVLQLHGFVWAKNSGAIQKPDAKGRKRFGIITSDISTIHQPHQIYQFIKAFNDPSNKYGEKCQIIIGSKKIAEGITLKNIRQVHVVLPHWNNPAIEQFLGRAYRVGSHTALPKDERYVNIYRHVPVAPHSKKAEEFSILSGKGYPQNGKYSDKETMSMKVYRIAEDKEYYNTQIYRIMKESSWDCPLTYERNVLDTDTDKSRDCDYQKCNYVCDGYPSSQIDKTNRVWRYFVSDKASEAKNTYNMFYSGEIIDGLIQQIIKVFGLYFNLRSYLLAELVDVDYDNPDQRLLFLRALEIIINSRIPIKNRYGIECYLKEEGNFYFLDQNVSVFASYADSVYVSSPYVTESISLETIAEIAQLSQDKKIIAEFCQEPKKLSYMLSELNFRTLIVLLEKIYEISVTKPHSRQTKREKEAITEIMQKIGSNLKTVKGTTIHNMYATEYTGLGYNVTVQELKPTGMMRVFDNETKEWRYVASTDEEEMFIYYIKEQQRKSQENVWEGNPYDVFGFIEKDGKFKIREKEKPGRAPTRGSVCAEVSWTRTRLYNLFIKLNFLPPTELHKDKSKDELLKIIKAQPDLKNFLTVERSTDELRRILALKTYQKKNLCAFVEEWFRDNNLFFDYSV